jgi:hypothetical protein
LVLERLISGREHVDDERAARGGRRENLDVLGRCLGHEKPSALLANGRHAGQCSATNG